MCDGDLVGEINSLRAERAVLEKQIRRASYTIARQTLKIDWLGRKLEHEHGEAQRLRAGLVEMARGLLPPGGSPGGGGSPGDTG